MTATAAPSAEAAPTTPAEPPAAATEPFASDEAARRSGSGFTAGAGGEMLVESGLGAGERAAEMGPAFGRTVTRVCVGYLTDSGPSSAGAVAMRLPAGVGAPEDVTIAAGEDVVTGTGHRPGCRERSQALGGDVSADVVLVGVEVPAIAVEIAAFAFAEVAAFAFAEIAPFAAAEIAAESTVSEAELAAFEPARPPPSAPSPALVRMVAE